MSMSSAIVAGRAYVELLLKDESFKAKLKKSGETMQAWGKGLKTVGTGMMAAGAAMLAPFIAAIPLFASGAARLDDLANRLTAPVDELQRLAYAGEMAGVSLEEMMPGLVDFEKNLAKSGKSGKDLVGQLMAIADKLEGIEDPAKKMELLSKYFGGGAAMMMPLLAGGSKGLGVAMGQADSKGLVMSKEDIASAAALDDAYTELTMTVKALGNTLASAVIPYLTPMVEYATATIAAFTEWADQNRGLVATFVAVVSVLATVGAAFYAVSTVVSIAGTIMAGFTTVLGLIAAPAAPVILTILAIVAAVAALAAGIGWLTGAWGGATKAAATHTDQLKKLREQQAQARAQAAAAGDMPDADKALGKANSIIRPANIGFSNSGAADRFGIGFRFNDNVPAKRQVKLSELQLEWLKKIEKKTGPARWR